MRQRVTGMNYLRVLCKCRYSRYSITTIYNTSTLHLWHTILNKRAWNWMCSNHGTSPRETTTIYVERWNPHSTSFHRLLHGARLLHGVLWWKCQKCQTSRPWDRNDRNSERSGKDAKKKHSNTCYPTAMKSKNSTKIVHSWCYSTWGRPNLLPDIRFKHL